MAAPNMQEVVPYAVNFGVVVVLLFVLLRKPTRKFIYQRHERMKDAVEAAKIAYEKARTRADAAKGKMQSVGADEAALVSRERQSTEAEKNEIMEKSRVEAKRLVVEADRLAEVEQEDASEKVKEQFLQLIVAEAEKSLKQGLKRDDHTAILKRAQNSIEVGV